MSDPITANESALIIAHLTKVEDKLDTILADSHKDRERLVALETSRAAQDTLNEQHAKTSESILARLVRVEESAITSKTQLGIISAAIGAAVAAFLGWFFRQWHG